MDQRPVSSHVPHASVATLSTALRIITISTWLIHPISEVLVSQRRMSFSVKLELFLFFHFSHLPMSVMKRRVKAWRLLGGCSRGASRPEGRCWTVSWLVESTLSVRENEECSCPSHKDAGRNQTTKFFPKLVTDSCVNPPCLGSESHNVL